MRAHSALRRVLRVVAVVFVLASLRFIQPVDGVERQPLISRLGSWMHTPFEILQPRLLMGQQTPSPVYNGERGKHHSAPGQL